MNLENNGDFDVLELNVVLSEPEATRKPGAAFAGASLGR